MGNAYLWSKGLNLRFGFFPHDLSRSATFLVSSWSELKWPLYVKGMVSVMIRNERVSEGRVLNVKKPGRMIGPYHFSKISGAEKQPQNFGEKQEKEHDQVQEQENNDDSKVYEEKVL